MPRTTATSWGVMTFVLIRFANAIGQLSAFAPALIKEMLWVGAPIKSVQTDADQIAGCARPMGRLFEELRFLTLCVKVEKSRNNTL